MKRTSSDNIKPYLIPENWVLLIASYRQGIALETQVHWRIMVPNIWHVLQRKDTEMWIKLFMVCLVRAQKEQNQT